MRSDESRPEQADAEALAGVRWAPERAWRWQAHRSWLCGVNYLPSVAVNWIDMWQRSSFAPGVIARELGWAAQLGINSVRLGLPYIVWSDDADRLLARLDHVLGLLDDRSMTAMLYLLDDCEFSGRPPRLGAQPDPVPGLHNSRATGSPGRALVMNERAWPDVERYVAHVVRAFAHDDRVVAWDLYNEPGNRVIFTRDGAQEYDDALEAHALRLLRRVFARARAVGPSQPLTSGGWRVPPPYAGDGVEAHVHPLDIAAFELSDIVSFHAYCSAERMQRIIARLRHYERPLLCTEWMGRQADSRLTEQLPLLHRQDVGSYVWGFVRGRSQTNLPWPDFLDSASRNSDEWFHDLIDAEGAAYDDDEVEAIRRETSRTHG